ncbi:MAG: thioredoxin family protein [candidate division WOR-3 bacterium]
MALLSKEDRDYLKNLYRDMKKDVNILFFRTDDKNLCVMCDDIKEILDEMKDLSDKIKVKTYSFEKDVEDVKKYNVKMAPAIVLLSDKDLGVKYYGIPAGYEFSSFVEDINDIGNDFVPLDESIEDDLKSIDKDVHIKVFVTHSCPYCPAAVRTAHKFAMKNEKIKADMIDANTFYDYADSYGVSAVPKVVINDKESFEGGLPEKEFLRRILNSLM